MIGSSRSSRRVAITVLIAVCASVLSWSGDLGPLRAVPAAASIRYDLHYIYNPPAGVAWNGRKIYISPGHFPSSPNTFPCGNTGQSEYTVAWHIGFMLRDALQLEGYMVMMPIRSSNVSYTHRIDTAYDWWSNKTNNRVGYVALHSNAHGSVQCSHSGSNSHGGTQRLMQNSYDNNRDFNYVSPAQTNVALISPGTPAQHERTVTDRCTNPNYPNNPDGVFEICGTKAREIYTIYMENEYHDTTDGANWLFANEQRIANALDSAIQCYYFGVECF